MTSTEKQILKEIAELKSMVRALTGQPIDLESEIAHVKASGGSLLEHFQKKARIGMKKSGKH